MLVYGASLQSLWVDTVGPRGRGVTNSFTINIKIGKFHVVSSNPEFFLIFPRGRQIFFNPHGDLKISIFYSSRHKGSYFVNCMLFIPKIMTFFFKKIKYRDHLDHQN